MRGAGFTRPFTSMALKPVIWRKWSSSTLPPFKPAPTDRMGFLRDSNAEGPKNARDTLPEVLLPTSIEILGLSGPRAESALNHIDARLLGHSLQGLTIPGVLRHVQLVMARTRMRVSSTPPIDKPLRTFAAPEMTVLSPVGFVQRHGPARLRGPSNQDVARSARRGVHELPVGHRPALPGVLAKRQPERQEAVMRSVLEGVRSYVTPEGSGRMDHESLLVSSRR